MLPLWVLCTACPSYAVFQIAQTCPTPTAASWRRCYPRVAYRCFDDERMASFVRAHDARWAAQWPALPGIVRADAFRYLFAWHVGGVYADSDCSCVRPYPQGAPLVVGVESALASSREARRVGMREGVQFVQWTFASEPRQPAMDMALVQLARALPAPSPLADPWVLNATGPWLFTRACLAQRAKRVLPKCAFAATGYPTRACAPGSVLSQHLYAQSWRRSRHFGQL